MKKCELITSPLVTAQALASCVACDLGGEMVILNMESGIYFGLNGVGAEIWNSVQSECSVSEIVAALMSRYSVDPVRCEREVVSLLERMAAQDLVVLKGSADSD